MSERKFDNLSTKANKKYQIGQLTCASHTRECANIIESHCNSILIIISNVQSVLCFQKKINQFTKLPIIHFSFWKIIPYDSVLPHQYIISNLLSASLLQLSTFTKGILITVVSSFMQRIYPHSFLCFYTVDLHQWEKLSYNVLCYELIKFSYHHAAYSIQEKLFIEDSHPYDIDFYNKKINNLQVFDIYSQHFLKKTREINLLPAQEFSTNKAAIQIFCNQWSKLFDIRHERELADQQARQGLLTAGIEYWQPLSFKHELPINFSYLPLNTLIVNNLKLLTSLKYFWNNINRHFKVHRIDSMHITLKPNKLWLSPDGLVNQLKVCPYIQISTEILCLKSNSINVEYVFLSNLKAQLQSELPLKLLQQFLEKFKKGIQYRYGYSLMIGANQHGFIDTYRQIALIYDGDLLGRAFHHIVKIIIVL